MPNFLSSARVNAVVAAVVAATAFGANATIASAKSEAHTARKHVAHDVSKADRGHAEKKALRKAEAKEARAKDALKTAEAQEARAKDALKTAEVKAARAKKALKTAEAKEASAKRHIKKDAKKHTKKQVKKVHHKKVVARPASAAKPAASSAASAASAASGPVGISGNWNLALDSEFNTSSLNTNVWRSGWYGTGITDSPGDGGICNSSSNVTFPGDGTMHLNLTATPSTCQGGNTYPYTGSLVSSNPQDGRSGGGFQYTYGVLEARVYVPGNGTSISNWPAVWADGQSWPNDGEDDLMEGLSGTICWHFHDPLGGPGGCDSSITPGWHTFASDWQPGSVTYYYDGQDVGSITTGITNAPMYIILSNGAPVGASNIQADSMQVQYVRVWQQ